MRPALVPKTGYGTTLCLTINPPGVEIDRGGALPKSAAGLGQVVRGPRQTCDYDGSLAMSQGR